MKKLNNDKLTVIFHISTKFNNEKKYKFILTRKQYEDILENFEKEKDKKLLRIGPVVFLKENLIYVEEIK